MSNMGIKNEIVMELSIKLAEKELCDNHDVKVDDISEERDGCIVIRKIAKMSLIHYMINIIIY